MIAAGSFTFLIPTRGNYRSKEVAIFQKPHLKLQDFGQLFLADQYVAVLLGNEVSLSVCKK